MFCYNCLDCRWKTGLLRGEHWTSWREGSKPEGGSGGGGGGGRLWGEGVQNSCLALVVMCEFDLLYCCSSETSLNPF